MITERGPWNVAELADLLWRLICQRLEEEQAMALDPERQIKAGHDRADRLGRAMRGLQQPHPEPV